MSDTNVYSQILREDIPESYRDLLDTLGRETFFKVVRACSGQNLYIPKWESLERNARDGTSGRASTAATTEPWPFSSAYPSGRSAKSSTAPAPDLHESKSDIIRKGNRNGSLSL